MNRDEQILSLRKSVEVLAKKYARITTVPYDDLVSAGWLAAIQVVDNFDPSKQVKLKSFAEFRIRGAMQDLLKTNLIYSSCRSQQGVATQVDIDKAYLQAKDDILCIENRADLNTLATKANLTIRQHEVLAGLLNGLNLEEISQRDGVQPNAVKDVKNTLMRKLGWTALGNSGGVRFNSHPGNQFLDGSDPGQQINLQTRRCCLEGKL